MGILHHPTAITVALVVEVGGNQLMCCFYGIKPCISGKMHHFWILIELIQPRSVAEVPFTKCESLRLDRRHRPAVCG